MFSESPYVYYLDEPLKPEKGDLFDQNQIIERTSRRKNRPLGQFSDYVVTVMPAVLRDGTLAQLHEDIEKRMPGHSGETVLAKVFNFTAPARQSLKKLDLKMALNACRYLAVKEGMSKEDFLSHPIHCRLMDLIEVAAGGKGKTPFMLTYEDIVLNNPADDMRVFTTGKTGFMEREFYRGHQVIESLLAEADVFMKDFIDSKNSVLPGPAVLPRSLALRSAQNYLHGALDVLGLFLSDLPQEDFNGFKPFFNTCPYTGEKGPSGAFSAKVPYTDMLVYGKDLPAYEGHYLKANAPYFPAQDLKNAFNAASGANLLSQCREDPAMHTHARECVAIANLLLAFRVIHLKTVKHQIGDAVTGSAEGQGALHFLEQRVKDFTALRDKMAACFDQSNTKTIPQRNLS